MGEVRATRATPVVAPPDPPIPLPAPPWRVEREAVSKSTRPSDEDGASSAAPPTNHPTLGTRWHEEEEDPAVGGNRIDPGEEIESFFGQLWAIPAAPPRARAPVGEGFLVWV